MVASEWPVPTTPPGLVHLFTMRATLAQSLDGGDGPLGRRTLNTVAKGEFRGERLRIIDPGIVPERPSSPNIPLNVLAALFLGLVLPVIYLTLQMSYQEQRAGSRRSVLQTVAKPPETRASSDE